MHVLDGCHAERDNTLDMAQRSPCWMPIMKQSISDYVAACEMCQSKRSNYQVAPLCPIIAKKPMKRWQMDLTIYPNFVCLLIVDCFSKYKWAQILPGKVFAGVAQVVKKLFYTIVKFFIQIPQHDYLYVFYR